MTISDLRIDTSSMPAAATTRRFTVTGDRGAEFILYILQDGTLKFYDWDSKTFALGHNSTKNNLKVKLQNKNFSGQIIFHSGGGTYTIKLEAAIGTEILGLNKDVISKSISKSSGDVTVTLTPITTNTNNYATLPKTTATGPPGSNSSVLTGINWDITNVSNDSYGFGLRIGGTEVDSAELNDIIALSKWWYFTTTDTVDGAITNAEVVVVDDITDISVGMVISGVSAGSLSGTPYVIGVDTATKAITMSSTQTFFDGITLTFKAEGLQAITDSIGLTLKIDQEFEFSGDPVTKTVRAGSSSTTINLNGTYGIMGGGHTPVSGLNINNESSTTTVSSVSASSGAGSIVVNNSQSGLITASTLTFNSAYQTVNILGGVVVDTYPSENRTVYFDIDKFLTVGAAS